MSEVTNNITNNGGSPQNNVGQEGGEAINVTNNTSTESDWRELFLELAEQVKSESWTQDTPPEVVSMHASPRDAVMGAIDQIETDMATDDVDEETYSEMLERWGLTFKSVFPLCTRLASVGGKAYLGHVADNSAAGAAAKAVFTDLVEMTKESNE